MMTDADTVAVVRGENQEELGESFRTVEGAIKIFFLFPLHECVYSELRISYFEFDVGGL